MTRTADMRWLSGRNTERERQRNSERETERERLNESERDRNTQREEPTERIYLLIELVLNWIRHHKTVLARR